MKLDMTERMLRSESIFEGAVLHVKKDTVSLPSGATSTREYCVHKGAVAVLPLTADGEVILVRQFRYAPGRVFLEVPAGKLDSVDEVPREAALRELREETGAVCQTLTPIGALIPSPALLTEKIHMFLAEGLTFGDTDPDEDEFLEIVKMPLSELVDMTLRGEIEDAKTQIMALKVWEMKKDTVS